MNPRMALGRGKASWPRNRLLHPGCLSLTPRGLPALAASAYAPLPVSSGASGGSGCLCCPPTLSICSFIHQHLFIHLSHPCAFIGVPRHMELNVAPGGCLINKVGHCRALPCQSPLLLFFLLQLLGVGWETGALPLC